MGGPCYFITPSGKKPAPACTDNFQISIFEYPLGSGELWHSVEQCYQGQKFPTGPGRVALRNATPLPGESDHSHGYRVWDLGQKFRKIRADWDSKKVEVMYLINVAKYASHEDLRAELLSTNDTPMVGAPSTWEWSKWNGRIQMLIRKKLQSGIDMGTITEVTPEEFEDL